MAKTTRTKEIWHIPKRGCIHQTVYMVYLLNQDDFNGKAWTAQKQEKIGTEMGKAALTKNGKAISHQSVRTLLANIPQYLGFVYKDESVNPTKINVTKAGLKLLEEFPLENILKFQNSGRTYHNNLSTYVNSGNFINQSNVVRHQMMKLIITNPFLLNDCRNIFLFPFKFTIKILLELGYIDKEEIAYILFHAKTEDSLISTIERIKSFRSISSDRRSAEITAYEKTEEGQITLAKAASASYYMELCCSTGLCKKVSRKAINSNKTLTSLELVDPEIIESVLSKYKEAVIYDFKDNSNLWYEYISEPERLLPPHDVVIKTNSKKELLLTIYKDDLLIFGDTLVIDKNVTVPFFGDEEYLFIVNDLVSGSEINKFKKVIGNKEEEINIRVTENDSYNDYLSQEDIIVRVTEMFSSSAFEGFDSKYYAKLKVLESVLGKSFIQSIFKGGVLEYLFYSFLLNLKNKGIIDEVFWNGKIVEYGIPISAPGGKMGTPDIYFEIDNISVVLELTTIRAITMQWSAEGSSVPDHIAKHNKLFPDKKVIGIFSAPEIYYRVKEHLELNSRDKVLAMLFYPCLSLLNQLNEIKNRSEMIEWLLSESSKQIEKDV